jgi:hypothetical protein
MNVDPGRPAFRARVDFGWPAEYAGKHWKKKASNEFFPLRATRRDTGRQVGVNVV